MRVPQENGYQIYGLIHDIHIDDDGLVRQLVTAEGVDENVIADNRAEPQRAAGDERAVGGVQPGRARSTTCCRRARRSAWM